MNVRHGPTFWSAVGRRLSAPLALLAAMLLLTPIVLLGGGLQRVDAGSDQAPRSIYSVDQIRADLANHPTAWVGRTVRIRGILEGAFVYCDPTHPCPPVVFGMIDARNENVAPDRLLRVALARPSPLCATLHRLPLFGALALPLQVVRFSLAITYRLRLRAAPIRCRHTHGVQCYEGVLLDAIWPAA